MSEEVNDLLIYVNFCAVIFCGYDSRQFFNVSRLMAYIYYVVRKFRFSFIMNEEQSLLKMFYEN